MRRVVPSSQRITMRYEDLVRTPKQVAHTLCAFLGEMYSPDMLRFHTDAEHYMKADAVTSFNAAATRPISDDRVERWKNDLSPVEVAWIESICAEEMTRFGYTPIARRRPLKALLVQYAKTAYWHYDMWRNRQYRPYIVRHVPGASVQATLCRWGRRLSPSAAPNA